MTTVAVLLAIAPLGVSPLLECLQLDLEASGGTGFHQQSDGDGWTVSGFGALGAGTSLKACLDLPLRVEVGLGWDSHGAPWGRGVEALEVGRLELDLTAAAGVGLIVLQGDNRTLGLEALIGPTLRMIRVSTRVRDESQAVYRVAARVTAAAGPYATFGPWWFALRARAGLPWDDAVVAVLAVGYVL
ncbi:MAG: hypothetical protein V3T05_00605 [Myxococcota bacterium]